MASKKEWLKKAKLYLILDRQVNTYDELFDIARKAVSSGVDILQLRDKCGSAQDILKFSERILKVIRRRVPYIINDRVDLAMISGASGVHLGQEDIPYDVARKMLGPKAMIGISCQTLRHVNAAQQAGADYLGFGSVFKTLTKPGRTPMDQKLLKAVYQNNKIPVFAIGGINSQNVQALKDIGVDRVAVCRSVCLAKDIKKTIYAFKNILEG